MLIRIVKMTFHPEFVPEFRSLFDQFKSRIAAAEGCSHLSLLRDAGNENVYFTYSHWDGPEFLELYRNSDTFQEVWPRTKAGFAARPEAWSLIPQEQNIS
ncbi:MAG: antibiotic biosynthesis monooxygenase [Flavobacteriales bacterium]|nr:antibiotic biosynthesis monooxygenase [Flavobacteriales bacterium]